MEMYNQVIFIMSSCRPILANLAYEEIFESGVEESDLMVVKWNDH